VILDTVQFTPRDEEHRAKLKTPQGTHWLTVPVHKISRGQRILETRLDLDHPWQKKALKTLAHLYGKSPCYAENAQEIADVIRAPHTVLTELDRASWGPALRRWPVTCKFVLASELPVTGRGPQLLLDLCKHVGADVYLSGPGGRKYLDPSRFAAQEVEVRYHDYHHPVYPQRFGEFVPFLSYLDMLFNAGLGETGSANLLSF